MILDIILLVVGIALVLWGADRFTDAASALARRWNVSELIIGLTVVAMGTSLPELIVSLFSSIKGSGDMSVGNIIGSNIFNTLVIIGTAAIMMPMKVSKRVLWRDIPFTILAAISLYILATNGQELSLLDGLLLFICFLFFLAYTLRTAKNENEEPSEEQVMSLRRVVVFLVLGVACLIGGGNIMIDSAESIALSLGISERIIGLTILAAGTSFPELATSIVAASKGSKGLALGNALGSNVFNVFFVLGICPIIRPIRIDGISNLDWITLILSALVLFFMALTRRKIERFEGVILLLIYFAYLGLLIADFSI